MRRLATLWLICLTPAMAARAETLSSAYTSYDINSPATCKQIDQPAEAFGGGWLCKGYGNLTIYTADGDDRTLEAYGRNPKEHCAVLQTFLRFNETNATVEWRLADRKPFATIVRWHVTSNDEGTETRSWLVVTKLEPANSCRVAVIEGALPDANARAREAADTLARSFNCQSGIPKLIAKPGRRIEDLLSGFPCSSQE